MSSFGKSVLSGLDQAMANDLKGVIEQLMA